MTKVSDADIAMVGKTFQRLTALEALGEGKVKFRCQCGSIVIKVAAKVRFGHTKSCGCLHKEVILERNIRHGKTGTRIHIIWSGMMARCYDKNSTSQYPKYGGRGITVEASWHIFENFYKDMGDPPEGYSLERRRNNEGYSKENCKWATVQEQSWNKRSSVAWEINGICYRTTKDACEATGLCVEGLNRRACGRFQRGKWIAPIPNFKKIFRGKLNDKDL